MPDFFPCYVVVSLSGKVVRNLNPLQFEMALAMTLVDKKMHLAQMSIAACWRGIIVRRVLREEKRKRYRTIITIQRFFRRKAKQFREEKEQNFAA